MGPNDVSSAALLVCAISLGLRQAYDTRRVLGALRDAATVESAELVSVVADLRGSIRDACPSASVSAPCPACSRCPLVTCPVPTPTPCPAPSAPVEADDGLLRHARRAAWLSGAWLLGVLCGCCRGGSCLWRRSGILAGASGGADAAPSISQRVTIVGPEPRVGGDFSAWASHAALPEIAAGAAQVPRKRRGGATPGILGDLAVRGVSL